jgi:phosphonate transport system substrate-binding protein
MRSAFLLPLVAALFVLWGGPVRAGDAPVYTIGVVPQFDLRRIQSAWGPIAERLRSATGASFRLTLDRDIPSFEKRLHAGEFDFAYMNPYHYVVASRRQGYRALVRDVEEPLYGIVVVPVDSPITSVPMLDGKVVAFPSPNAMGAALIPRAEFARKFHIKVVESYVKSHTSAYLNVVMGQADAAGGILATFEQQPSDIRGRLRVLYETERHTPHPLAVAPRVPAELAAKVRAALLALAEQPEGRALLADIPVRRLGPAEDRDYDPLRHLGLEAFYVE